MTTSTLPTLVAGRLHRLVYADLLRVAFADRGRDPKTGLDCFGLVLEVLRRLGRPAPDDVPYSSLAPGDATARGRATGAWEEIVDPEPGEVVLGQLVDPVHPDHVGILVSADEVLHITEAAGAVIEPLSRWRDREWLRGFFRPRPPAARPIRILWQPDPIRGQGAQTLIEEWRPGLTIADLVPTDHPRLQLRRNGWPVTDRSLELAPGDELLVRLDPGIPVPAALIAATGISAEVLALAGNIVIGSLVGLVASLITAPQPQRVDKPDEASPTFNLDAVRNTVANGTTVAVIYGQHRFGGQVLQLYFEVDALFRSTLYMLLSLGEGEIESIGGLSGDWNDVPASSIVGNAIEIDGNQAAAFPNLRISTRMGRTRQAVIPDFDRTVVAFGQDRLLRAPSPLVPGQTAVANNTETFLYTTSQAVDGFALMVQYPIGLYKIDATSGQEEDYSVYYTLRYQRKGNPASEVVEVVIHGPSQKKADHTRMIKRVGLARDVWEIRITRMSDNDENLQRRYSVSKLVAVNEYVSDDPIAHNGKALLAIKSLNTGQLSGGVPTVTALVKGKRVHAWDGVSTTAPAFSFAWSDNPAWVVLDMLLHKTYGLGRFYSLADVDLAAFKSWADYCADVITTDGVAHARWQFNFAFDSALKVWDAIGIVAAAGRATVVLVGSKWTVVIERATSPSMLFSMGNIIRGSFVTHYPKTLDRPNMVRIQYRNAALDFDSDVAQLETGIGPGEQYVRDDFQLAGITNARQAYRAAKYLLNLAQGVTEAYTWRAPVDAIACYPGQVVEIEQDVLLPGATGGRLKDAPSNKIVQLDRGITIPASPAWTIKIQSYDPGTGTRIQQTATPTPGTYAKGDDISIAPALSVLPLASDVYAIGPSTSYLTQARITRIARKKNQEAQIDAVKYVASVYSDDPGPIETFTEVWPDRRYHPVNPTGLRLVENTSVNADGTVHWGIDVSFVPEKEGHAHDVWVRRMQDDDAGDETNEAGHYSAEDWRFAGSTTNGGLKIAEGVELKRPYQVSVTPRSPAGNRQDPRGGTKRTFFALGRLTPPAAPTALKASELADGRVRLSWTPSTSRDTDRYEVRAILNTTDSRKWLLAQVLATGVKGCEVAVIPPKVGGLYFLVAAVSRSGVESWPPAALSYTPKGNDRAVLTTTTEALTWPGTKTKMTVVGTALRSDLNETTGSYVTTNIALSTSGGLLALLVDASAWEIDWTVDEAGYLMTSPHAQRKRVDGLLMANPEPDQVLPFAANHYRIDAPGSHLHTVSGAKDWATGFRLLVEYDLAVDSGATTWDGWTEYSGPIQIPTNRYYVRVRVTLTNFAGAKLRIQLDTIHVTQTTQAAKSIVATDPNSHYAGADDVDARLVELGWILKEQTKHWPNVQFWPSRWMEGGTFSYQVTPDMFGVQAQDAATPTLGYAVAVIPSWYLKSGSTVYTIDFYYWIGTSPGADQVARIEVKHRTFDQGDANFGSYTTTNLDLSIPNGTTANAPKRASLDVTSGDFGSGDEMLHLAIRRQGTVGADTYTGTVYIYGVKIRSGVKAT